MKLIKVGRFYDIYLCDTLLATAPKSLGNKSQSNQIRLHHTEKSLDSKGKKAK